MFKLAKAFYHYTVSPCEIVNRLTGQKIKKKTEIILAKKDAPKKIIKLDRKQQMLFSLLGKQMQTDSTASKSEIFIFTV